MEKQYFLLADDQQQGPFTRENLIQLEITAETMVWAEGFVNWTKAGEVDELKYIFSKPPPPPFSQKKTATPPPNPASINNSASSNSTSNGFFEKNKLIIFISIGVLVVGGLLLSRLGSGSEETANNEESVETEKDPTTYQKVETNDNTGTIESETKTEPKPAAKRQLTEDEMIEQLYQTEIANPNENLSASGSYKVNLAANTIVTGTIYNNASYAGYKNVKLVAKFYSKTDVLLGKEAFLVMEYVEPSNNVDFSYKITGWWSDIDHWSLEVLTAEGY